MAVAGVTAEVAGHTLAAVAALISAEEVARISVAGRVSEAAGVAAAEPRYPDPPGVRVSAAALRLPFAATPTAQQVARRRVQIRA